MKRKIIGIVMAMIMITLLVPTSAFAKVGESETGHNHSYSGYCAVCGQGSPVQYDEYYDGTEESVVQIDGVGYPSIQAAVQAAYNGATLYLMNDVTLEHPIDIDKDITIDGTDYKYTIYRGGGAANDALFNIKNCKVTLHNITLDGNYNYNYYSGYSLINVLDNAELTITNGATLKNNNASYGGAVYVSSYGKVIMNEGAIKECSADNSGGGIYSQGSLEISADAWIYGNSACWGGGIWTSGNITLSGAVYIAENYDIYGSSNNLHLESNNILSVRDNLNYLVGVNTHDGSSDNIQIGYADSSYLSVSALANDSNSSCTGVVHDDYSVWLSSGTSSEPVTEEYIDPNTDPYTDPYVDPYANPEPAAAVVHTVGFYNQMGYTPDAQYVTEGACAYDPGNPGDVAGYNFLGWYEDGAAYPFDFANTPLYTDIILYANWEAVPQNWTVTFVTDMGYAPENQTVADWNCATDPGQPTGVEGYNFTGWYDTISNYAFDFNTPITADTTLKAGWEAMQQNWIVTFVTDMGYAPENQTVADWNCATDPGQPTGVEGYNFTGWYDTISNYKFDFNTPITADTTLQAGWEAIPQNWTVTFITDQGYAPENQTVADWNCATDPGQPTGVEGYNFTGWYDNVTGSKFDFSTPITADTTLTAGWELIPVEWTVTFVTDLGIAPEAQVVNDAGYAYDPGEPGNVSTLSVDGTSIDTYIFEGWYDNATGALFDFSTPVTGDITLVAKWSENICKVTFVTEHGTVPEPQEISAGNTADKPGDPSERGWAFKGWLKDDAEYDFSAPVTQDITLTASWKKTHAVTVVNEKAEIVPQGYIIEDGDKLTILDDPSPVEGYIFKGWYLNDAAYDFDTPVTTDITLTAKWEKAATEQVTVKFDMNGHGEQVADQTFDKGGKASEPTPAPTAEGWTFKGWTKDGAAYDFTAEVTSDITLVASWEAVVVEDVTVTFETAHGTVPAEQKFAKGGMATEPEAPSEEGWTFKGWYLNDALYDFNTEVTSSITLTAKWEEVKKVKVTFVTDYGTTPAEQVIDAGQKATEPSPAPTAEGFKFEGWYFGDALFNFEDSPINSDITLTAKWTSEKKDTVTVTFKTDYGATPSPQTIEVGQKAIEPTQPTASGHVFEGWYNGTSKFDFNTAVTESITLTAKWSEVAKVTVTFKTDYGATPSPQNIEAGQKAIEPTAPTASGYVFEGWFNGSAKFDFNTAVTSSITLTAKWSAAKKTVTVTFDANGHGSAPAAQTMDAGQKAKKPADPTASGYIFSGWYTDKACTSAYNFGNTVNADLTLYAKWTEKSTEKTYYSVSFYTAHGRNPEGQLVESGKRVTRPTAPTAAGYVFIGWYTDRECKFAYDFNTAVTSNMTLYAKWTEEPTTIQYYKISFYTERGNTPGVQTVARGKFAYKPADPTANGYIFSGWYTEKECRNAFNFNTAIVANMTLYAKWTEIPSQNIIVTFDSNGHGNAPDAQALKSGETAVRPEDPTATGYTFNGWYTDAAATQAFNFNAAVSSNTTLYAGWVANRYTVKFDANGGVGNMASQSLVYDTKANLTPGTFTRTGYTFIGWNTKADGSGSAIANNATVENMTAQAGATVELFAQWRNNYTVIEGVNGKVQKGGTSTITFLVDGDYSKFTGISIDQNNVSSTQYSSWAGSTYVQLKSDYINQLSTGQHTIRFNYTDGSCETSFEVISGTPRTGDTNNIIIWIIIAVVCLILIAVVVLILLGKKNRRQ